MAYRFNGTGDYLRMTIGALSAAVAGPLTIAVTVKLNDTVDGSLLHLISSGGASGPHMEVFGGNVDYGTGATARNWSAVSTGDGWMTLVGRKTSGSTVPRGTKLILGGSTTHADATGGTVGDGSAVGGTGFVQFGRYANTAEYASMDLACGAVWTSVLTDLQAATLSTWAAYQALSPQFAVEFTGSSSRSDATAGGSTESSRVGTTLVADPAGFFGGVIVVSGGATFAADASMTAAAVRRAAGAATLTADAALVADGRRLAVPAGVDLAGRAQLDAVATRIALGSAAYGALSDLQAAPVRLTSGGSILSADGALTFAYADAGVVLAGGAALAADAQLVVDGGRRIVLAGADLAARSALTITAPATPGTVTLRRSSTATGRRVAVPTARRE